MWAILAKILTGGVLQDVTSKLEAAYQAKLNAENDAQKVAADLQIHNLETRRDIILQAQKDRFERWVRILFALPFIVYIWKLVIWDKVAGLGITDSLSPTLENIMWTVIGGYFVQWTIGGFKK